MRGHLNIKTKMLYHKKHTINATYIKVDVSYCLISMSSAQAFSAFLMQSKKY